MESKSRGTHPPLRRTNAKAPSTSDHSAAHPLLFSTSSNQSDTSTDSLASSTGAPSPPERGVLESHDSCYSSCSEESHASLSREASDSLARLSVSEEETLKESEIVLDEHLVEFATKLGYSEPQLRQVLAKFGSSVGQDRILNELIKMGKQPKSVAAEPELLSQQQSPSAPLASQPTLRSIVIDGSNIAMTHGRKEIFSCRGIRESVNFFRDRGHSDIIVFVPQFRREAPRSDCPITDQHILFELEAEQYLVFTPSRKINGRRIVCHDDRYILKTADEKEAVIVSNDEYRDLIKEHPHYRRLVEERLLMYSFVDGKFMPPDDPLGRYGPKLDAFLCKGRQQFNTQPCPYARKCTYGNKCKYFHPERPNGIRMSATDRLLKEKNNRQRTTLSSRPSMVYENSVVGRFPGYHQEPMPPMTSVHHGAIGRTQSLNVAGNFYAGVENQRFDSEVFGPPPPTPRAAANFHQFHPQISARLAMWTSTPPPQMHANQHNLLNRHMSAPLASQEAQMAPHQQLQPSLHPETNASRSNSISDFNSALFSQPQTSPPTSLMFAPSTSVWGEAEFSFGPIQRPAQGETRQTQPDDKLRYHLSQLFSESAVAAVMNAHPEETDPQKLCQRILALQQGFQNSGD